MNNEKSAWDAMLALGPAMLTAGLGIYARAKQLAVVENAKKMEEPVLTAVLAEGEITPDTILVFSSPAGTSAWSLRRWAEDPLIWLNGLDVDDLVGRAMAHRVGNDTALADAASILLLPHHEDVVRDRVEQLAFPPRGKKGERARQMARRFRGSLPALLAMPSDMLAYIRRGERQRDTLREALLQTEKALATTQAALKTAEKRVAQLEAQVVPHGELSALYEWWAAGPEDLERVHTRVFDLLGKMFARSGWSVSREGSEITAAWRAPATPK